MNQGVRLVKFDGEEAQTVAKAVPPQVELSHVRTVTSGVVQDALNVWADIWGELEGAVVSGTAIDSEAQERFQPSCGWPEFLEKMWVLRGHLEFMARFSRP
jgi:hypothetical protein